MAFATVDGHAAATFLGRGESVSIPDTPALRLGKGDFTISVRVHTRLTSDGDPGDILSHFDLRSRTGFHLGLRTNAGVATSQTNHRQLQFGIDQATEPVFIDEGRPGNAIFGMSMSAHDGRLYVGTCVAESHAAGRVCRYEGRNRWTDLGSPDQANSISAMAAWNGSLYVGSGKYRLKGTHLAESENPHDGGRIFRLRADSSWEEVGRLPGVEAVGGMVSFAGKLYASSLYKPASLFSHEGGNHWAAVALPGSQRMVHLGIFDGAMHAASYDNGNVYRFDGREWTDLGPVGDNTQTYGFAVHHGKLQVATWPSGRVFERDQGVWRDKGRLGQELEVMGMMVHNGCLYGGTLPLAQIYRHDGGDHWRLLRQIDTTQGVEYRRVWTMAQYEGRLFATTVPSGRVWSMQTGACVTWDREFPEGWRHVAARRQGDELRLFLDGASVAHTVSARAAGMDIDCPGDWLIGVGSGSFFRGALADLQVHRRALSAGEIARLAADPHPENSR